MLNLYEYSVLTPNQRAETLWTDGEFLANVADGDMAYSLYGLYEFYVEVTLIDNQISDVTPFKHGERLDKYLDQIRIAD